MPQNKLDKFLKDVLSYIKFPFVKDEIKEELKSHVLEKIDYYMDEGYGLDEAERLAINDMGDPKEIGIGLNKQHNPILGWMLKITNQMVVLGAILSLVFIVPVFLVSVVYRNPIRDIPKDNIEYRIDLDEQVRIDNRIINFTNAIYEKDGSMNIIYNYRETGVFPGGWGYGSIGKVSDDLGNEYFNRSGNESGGIRTVGRITIEDFTGKAEELIINYDQFNRKYRVGIPLEAGDNHE